MIYCQYIILALQVVSFFVLVHQDFYGKKSREPYGFTGFVITLILCAAFAFVYWKAGAFSLIIPS